MKFMLDTCILSDIGICSCLERKGMIIGSLDMMIAAHSGSIPAKIVSDNVREFERVPGLTVENWLRT